MLINTLACIIIYPLDESFTWSTHRVLLDFQSKFNFSRDYISLQFVGIYLIVEYNITEFY